MQVHIELFRLKMVCGAPFSQEKEERTREIIELSRQWPWCHEVGYAGRI